MKRIPRVILRSAVLAALLCGVFPVPPARADVTRRITFPIIGSVNYTNDWGAPRTGHSHEGNDIFGRKGQPLVAAVDGVVEWVTYVDSGYGLAFSIRDADGYAYWYLHVNNDTPGSDDGKSRGVFAFAPDLYGGNPVVAGQLLGWMGDSGNAERTPAHLHFEIHEPDGDPTNPFWSLQAARRLSRPVTPPQLASEILPFGQFSGGASVAVGDVDASSAGEEIVVGAGPGGGPQVRVYSQDNVLLSQFFAYEKNFRGGIDVATGDVDADGVSEVITTPGSGRRTQVRVFSASGLQRAEFPAYSATYSSGAHVAAADVTSDGRSDIVVGTLRGGGPQVRVFSGAGYGLFDQFFAYGKGFRGGIDVAAHPATDATPSLIVTTALSGGGPNVRVFNGRDHSLHSWFFAREQNNRAGLRVSIAELDAATPGPEIVVVPETNSVPRALLFDAWGTALGSYRFLEPWWQGGYDVAAGTSGIVGATATPGDARRRTSVRWLYEPSPLYWDWTAEETASGESS